MSSLSKLASGELGYLSDDSRNTLVKAAENIKKAGLPPNLGKNLFNYGVPALVGGGTAAYGLSQGQSPTIAAGEGAGAYMFSAPKGWAKIFKSMRGAEDPGEAFTMGLGKALVRKGTPLAVGAGLHYVPGILDNVSQAANSLKNTSANADVISSTIAKQPLAANANSWLMGMQNMANNVSGVTKDVGNALEHPQGYGKEIGGILGGAAGITGGGILLHHLLKKHEESKKHHAQ